MVSLFSRQRPRTARVNGRAITVEPKETLLHEALLRGIEFPHSCRVGGQSPPKLLSSLKPWPRPRSRPAHRRAGPVA